MNTFPNEVLVEVNILNHISSKKLRLLPSNLFNSARVFLTVGNSLAVFSTPFASDLTLFSTLLVIFFANLPTPLHAFPEIKSRYGD